MGVNLWTGFFWFRKVQWRGVLKIICHVDQLLRGDWEIDNYTAAVVRQRPTRNREIVYSALSAKQKLNSKRGTVLYVRSVPRGKNDI
jgi:hypothetical protein